MAPQETKPRGALTRLALSIWNRLRAREEQAQSAGVASDPKQNSAAPVDIYDTATGYFQKMRDDMDRHSIAVACCKAYENDARVNAAIGVLCEHATMSDNDGRPYKLALEMDEPDSRAQAGFDLLEERNKALGLEEKAEAIIDRFLNEGDAYYHVIANRTTGMVVDFVEVPGAREGFIICKTLDPATKVHNGWHLYEARFGMAMNEPVKRYAKWEIVQFAWKKKGNYGTPLFKAARTAIARMWEQEDTLVTARKERAYLHFIFQHKGLEPEVANDMANKAEAARLKKGRGTRTDTITGADQVTVVDAQNHQLKDLTDIEHEQSQVFTAGRVPFGLLGGFGRQVDRSVLDKQDQGLVRVLTKLDAVVSDGYSQLFDTILTLADYIPEEVPYAFIWTDKNEETFKDVVDALVKAQEGGLDKITGLEEMGYDPEVVMERHRQWRKFEDEIGGDEIDRRIREELNGSPNGNGDGEVEEDGVLALFTGEARMKRKPVRRRGANRWKF